MNVLFSSRVRELDSTELSFHLTLTRNSQCAKMAISNPDVIPGMTTREIAEICDMDIYSARYFLLKLHEKGLLFHRKKTQNKS